MKLPVELIKCQAALGLATWMFLLFAVCRQASAQTPVVSLSTSSLTFSTQNIGTSSPQLTITLTNSGTASLVITDIILSGAFYGDFAQTSTCGTPISPGAGCTINVRLMFV